MSTSAQTLLARAQDLAPMTIQLRREFHMNPELSFQEFRTAKRVAEELHKLGIETETGVGVTGVVGRIGEGSPVIAIRGDMDALPIQEANDVPYKSQSPGVMHACGHDAHTAILLTVAKLLVEMPDRPKGEIRLLFQPSEENFGADGRSGAVRMIEDGALDDLDAVIALHVSSDQPANKVGIVDGYAAAAVDTFFAKVKGEGCHGAYPHTGFDPIYMSAQVINAVHGIRARRINPVHPALISIGAIHAGHAENVIPAEVEMIGTIRSYSPTIREQLWAELERAFSVARALGGDYELQIIKGYPSLYNTPAVAEMIRSVTDDLFSTEGFFPEEPGMGAEDFSYMAQKAPGAMFMLGAKFDAVNRPHHSPIFDIAESALPIGAAVLAETAVRLLKNPIPKEG
ncbi:MAG TPA: amidohydrolase [Aggregatilineales bacterium]|nr:amidohydrolase [Anaerolineales bacterium]HRE47168.1 amidohydrolase [Aggregatilineales bacterium]